MHSHFIEASKNFDFDFYINKSLINPISTYAESTDLISEVLKKYSSRETIPLNRQEIQTKQVKNILPLHLPHFRMSKTQAKYGGRSPKFICAPCHLMCTTVIG
jgi:hypothetical protein